MPERLRGNRMLFKSSHYNDLDTTNNTIKDQVNKTNYSHSTLLHKHKGLAAGIPFKYSTMKTRQCCKIQGGQSLYAIQPKEIKCDINSQWMYVCIYTIILILVKFKFNFHVGKTELAFSSILNMNNKFKSNPVTTRCMET